MPFLLSKIELHIEDDLLARAEALLHSDQLSEIREEETGLWIATVTEDGDAFEAEVLLSKGYVKGHTCDCGQFDKKQYCLHVVTLLLHLLDIQKKKKEKTPKPPEVKIPKRITLSYLLDLVEPMDLKAFIKDYASQDRNFGLLLKAHFAHLLPRTADNEPIGETLANTIKAVKKPGKTMSRNDWKMIQQVLTTFLQQAEEGLYKKDYAFVFETTEAILQQLSPLLLMTEDRSVFQEAIVNSLLLLFKMQKADLAPELENEIWNLAITEADKRVYYFYELWSPLGKLLLQMANTKERRALLLDLLEEKSQDNFVRLHPEISAGIVNFKIQLFELQDNEAALRRYLEENIHHPEVLKQAILLARQSENWTQLEQLLHFALPITSDPEELIELKAHLLTTYVVKKKRKKIRVLAQELFLETFNQDYLQILKKSAGKKWPEWRTDLLRDFKQLPNHSNKIKMLALIYSAEHMTTELHLHLKESLSLDLLREYDDLLFQQDSYKTGELYKEVIDHYLENYVGRPAAIKVRESITHLAMNKREELALSLLGFVKEKYGDRGSLLEELGEL